MSNLGLKNKNRMKKPTHKFNILNSDINFQTTELSTLLLYSDVLEI